mgnify:CR=1 FL=1
MNSRRWQPAMIAILVVVGGVVAVATVRHGVTRPLRMVRLAVAAQPLSWCLVVMSAPKSGTAWIYTINCTE